MYTLVQLQTILLAVAGAALSAGYFWAPKMVANSLAREVKSLARKNEARIQTNAEQAITIEDNAKTIKEINRQIANLKKKYNALELKRNQKRSEIEKELRQDLINPIRQTPFALTEELNKFLCLSCLIIHKTPNVYCERLKNMPSVLWCKKCKERTISP